MKHLRALAGPVCLAAWATLVWGAWEAHRRDVAVPTLVRVPVEAGIAETTFPSQGGRHAFLLAWPHRKALLEDPLQIDLAPADLGRGTLAVGRDAASAAPAPLADLDRRDARLPLEALVPYRYAARPWTYLGAKSLPPGEVYVRFAAPPELATNAPAAPTSRGDAAPAPPTEPLHLWIVPTGAAAPLSPARDPENLLLFAGAAAVLLLGVFGATRRGPPIGGSLSLAAWLVVAATALAVERLDASRRLARRVPLVDGAATTTFDARNGRIKFFLAFDDAPAPSAGPRRITLPASAWRRGSLSFSDFFVHPTHHAPVTVQGRWDLLEFYGAPTAGMEKGLGAFRDAAAWEYLGECRFGEGLQTVRFAVPKDLLPAATPAATPTALWLVPDRHDRLGAELFRLFLVAVVGIAGLLCGGVALLLGARRARREPS